MRAARLLVLLVVLAGAALLFAVLAPFGPRAEAFVDVPAGTGARQVAKLLEDKSVVRNEYAFDLLRAALRGRLQAGEYRFDHPASMLEVYGRLRRGDVYTRTLVIPEGYNVFDIGHAIEAAGLGSAVEFLAAARSHPELVQQWSPHAASLEGFLYPATYRFSRHTTPLAMLSTMVRQWQRSAEPLFLTAPIEPYTAAQHETEPGSNASSAATPDWNAIVTMASLIEREVREPAERPLVAGVFRNRLRRGMPLQTDPAVIYAALLDGRYRGTIYASDLANASPYNTYRHAGLPPGPICNPGLSSLRAAMHPATTEYLYFVSDAAGHTRFATDLKQQAQNVQSYRRAAGHEHESTEDRAPRTDSAPR